MAKKAAPTKRTPEVPKPVARKAVAPKAVEAAAEAGSRHHLPLARIGNTGDRTRDLNPAHVAALVESISALGMIHPPVVDRQDRLLAGAHRLAALHRLESEQPGRFQELFPSGVPVWRMDLDADSDQDLALAVEISENEQRRDYSAPEIQRLAERLKAAGFHYAAEGGRPPADARPLMPALEVIVGKSVRQLRRILNPPGMERAAAGRKSGPAAETRSDDLVSEVEAYLLASEKIAARLGDAAHIPELFTLKGQVERIVRLGGNAVAALRTAESQD